jgi:acetolactate synthase-1/2/3 large subunit
MGGGLFLTRYSGGQMVVQVLEQEGVKRVFCVPGESYLSVLDALYEHPQIRLISNRHEGGASFMAEAYAKASGEVGVCMATRAVGASNLAIGLHTAHQDSTPLVALIGQVESGFAGREAFQEVDLAAFFSHLCKWTVEIRDVKRIPELLHRAFHIARSGRPGPVVVALPHDLSEDVSVVSDVTRINFGAPIATPRPPRPAKAAIERVLAEIQSAEQPVVICGAGVLQTGATRDLVRFAGSCALPVVTAFRRFDAFPNSHPCYAGWLGFGPSRTLLEYIRGADLVIALGTRFSQVSTQDYRLLGPDARLVHVDVNPNTFGQVYTPTLPIVADVKAFLEDILVRMESVTLEEGIRWDTETRREIVQRLHRDYLEFSTPPEDHSQEYVDLDGMMADFRRIVPKDAVITSDAGNFFGWVCRYWRFEKPGTYIGPTSGAMGYGLPAAIGAKLAHPDRLVINFAGDGGFMMTIQELETAVRYQVPVVNVVVNNNLYGTIRAHQEKHYPKRVVGTDLTNPNFAELAKLFGGYGEQVRRNADFVPALERAIHSGLPAVVEVCSDPRVLSATDNKIK